MAEKYMESIHISCYFEINISLLHEVTVGV